MASSTPASVKSGTTSAPRGGTGASLRWSREGGIDRAGVTRTARGGATCLVGIGDGIGSVRRPGACVASTLTCVLRAGVVARDRVTAALDLDLDLDDRPAAGRDGRAAGLRALVRAVLRGVWRLAEREGVGLRDEDFTDNSPGMTGW